MLKRILFVMVLVLSMALTACGSAPAPVTFSSLPVFTGATISTNDQLVASVKTMNDAMSASASAIETRPYEAPAGSTWDAIGAFYSAALEKDGWTAGQATADGKGWSRGSQGIAVRSAGDVYFLVSLFTVK